MGVLLFSRDRVTCEHRDYSWSIGLINISGWVGLFNVDAESPSLYKDLKNESVLIHGPRATRKSALIMAQKESGLIKNKIKTKVNFWPPNLRGVFILAP